MAGFSVHINVEGLGLAEGVLRGIRERSEDLTIPLSAGGVHMTRSIRQNFRVGGRPKKWRPWAPATRRAYGRQPGRARSVLVGRGMRGGLMGSITSKAGRDFLVIGTNKIYGRIHQLGGQAGRGHATTIPARPYLVFQKSDVEVIARMVGEHLAGGA